jgi:hypothetical protein
MVVSLTNDPVIMNNDRPDKWICHGHSQAFTRKFKTTAHIYFISIRDQRCSFITIFD